ncbi:putative ATP-dependent RNA helicase TDRD12 isoform X2 [Leptidea sinapis]|uniref:putative ATP-dependent RNA helicase TDRD12 isoform X2 n=1 Tax=Leptidea sinapis TaxID=189913 RepID=UPI0021C437CF|nr:putative ATP-dependent RNA helicase TDRD12 isoform X2 [Leptidea sinapis]
MPLDRFNVEVIHHINPHLMWISIIGGSNQEENIVEQVGVFGIVPHEITLDIDTEKLVKIRCDDWVAAATNLTKEYFQGATETWFSPRYISRRAAISASNIHIFGEITIKTVDGGFKTLSDWLVNLGFAAYDETAFHSQLLGGQIRTIPNSKEMPILKKHLTEYSKRKQIVNNYINSTKNSDQTLHHKMSLSKHNLERHNKMHDNLEYEEDLKFHSISDDGSSDDTELSYKISQNIKHTDNNDVNFNKMAYFFDKLKECDEKLEGVDSVTDDKSDLSSHIDTYEINADEQRTADKKPTRHIGFLRKILQLKKSQKCNEMIPSNGMTFYTTKCQSSKEEEGSTSNGSYINDNETSFAKTEAEKPEKQSSGLRRRLEIMSKATKNQKTALTDQTEKVNTTKYHSILNSDDCKSYECRIKKNDPIISENEEKAQEHYTEIKSSALRRRLEIIGKITKNRNNAVLDTSEKGTSDDETNELIKKIDLEYPKTSLLANINKKLDEDKDALQNNVKLLSSNSVGGNVWEKLITHTVMVHSKSKKVNPVYAMRDIPFNEHIKIVLKHLSVEKIMTVQSISWKTILRGQSCILIGPRGSGKTIGYLPSICRLVTDGTPEAENSTGPIGIIICATALSVAQVETLAKRFVGLNDRVLSCYAGIDDMTLTTSLLNGCDLLICTPSPLVRLLQATEFGIDLKRLRTLVIDDCERIFMTYNTEVKFIQYKIREVEKNRANKELKVQYVLASRIWCNSMETLARRAPDTVISISAYQECILYSKTNMSVSLIKKEHKAKLVVDFLKETDMKKTVIVCRYNEEVALLSQELKCLKRYIFACNDEMGIGEFYQLSLAWNDYEDPLVGPILICTDDNLSHLAITDAHYLVHYSLPKLLSMFNKRFAVLIQNIPSIFSTEHNLLKIKVLLDEQNTENLPKILHFIKRCTDNVPSCLDDICQKVIKKKDVVKANNFINICDGLLNVGHCPDTYCCEYRHTIIKEFDDTKEWVPKMGTITFKVLHYHTAVCYSARVVSHFINNEEKRYPESYNKLSIKLGLYFGKMCNRKLHGIPKPGDVCAVSVNVNFFARCQVIKILSYCQRGNPKYVLIKLLDEEKYERTRDIYLYHLPEEFKHFETYVVEVRLANIRPKDKDVTFSCLAQRNVEDIVNSDKDLYLRGHVAGAIGNSIFVDSLEVCQNLSSLGEVVVRRNIKSVLLEKHADDFPEHLVALKKLCELNNFLMTAKSPKFVNTKQKYLGSWAHLGMNDLSDVFVSSIINPEKFFVRLSKFESCMTLLLKDIKKYIDSNPTPLEEVEVGDIVIAKFPEDSVYERARVDSVNDDRIKCFFVDQGSWCVLPLQGIYPITENIINQLPFQSIECRLLGVQAPGNTWTDYSINWLDDICKDIDNGDPKHLFVKCFAKERTEFTGGNKYVINLIDTNTEQDIVINKLMISLNLAKATENELNLLNTVDRMQDDTTTKSVVDEEDFDKVEVTQNISTTTTSLSNVFLPIPKRSVPLVESDYDSDVSDKWNFNMIDDFGSIFKSKSGSTPTEANLPAISYKNDAKSDGKKKKRSEFEIVTKTDNDLDSVDVSTLDTSISQIKLTPINETRKPKLIWHQTKTEVNVKIQLIGVESYELEIKDRFIKFETFLNDTKYYFEFDLFAVINKRLSSHSNKGQYIYVKLIKVLRKNWLSLMKDDDERWVIYDADSIDVSSDEEEVDSSVLNIVKQMINKQESDSDDDDDDFTDDVSHKYK